MSAETYMPQGTTPSTSSFTCNTCGIRFITAELQRQHMKTDWHRYNLKRRVAQLPAISSDVFAHKILQQQRLAHLQQEVDEFGFAIRPKRRSGVHDKKKKTPFGETRGRGSKFDGYEYREASPATSITSEFSQFSLGEPVVHEESESNIDTASELGYSEKSDNDFDTEDEFVFTTEDEEFATESETEDEEELVEVMPLSYCFYCGKNNQEIEHNIKHMFNDHGLYIPERAYLQDLEGLLTFVNEVITIDNECLSCGFQGKNLESIRQHMQSKRHCRIPYETKLEKDMISEFYNFDISEEDNSNSGSTRRVLFTEKDDNILIHLSNRRNHNETSSSYALRRRSPYHNNKTILPTGLQVRDRTNFRYIHPPASLVRRSSDSKKSVVVADRRYAPGITPRTVSKQEKQSRALENKAKNLDLRRAKSKRVNFQPHFRDEILQ